MSKNYLSAAKWAEQRNAMRRRGETATPPIRGVRTQGWSVTISLKDGSGNTLESVTELFEQLAQDDAFSGCLSEEEGKTKNDEGVGYHHIQAAVYWAKQKTGSWVLQRFEGTTAHIEPALNMQALSKYVKKHETHISGPYSFGHWSELEEKLKSSQRGKRTDLDAIKEAIDNGASFTELMLDPELGKSVCGKRQWVKDLIAATRSGKWQFSRRGINPEDSGLLSVDWIYGGTGKGKTTRIENFFGFKDVFYIREYNPSFPFEGYEGQKILVLDEFKGQLLFKQLLNTCYGSPQLLNVKGSSIWAGWEKVVIISSEAPDKLYSKKQLEDGDGSIMQLFRRLQRGVVINANEENGYPYSSVEDAIAGKPLEGTKLGWSSYGPDYWNGKSEAEAIEEDDEW